MKVMIPSTIALVLIGLSAINNNSANAANLRCNAASKQKRLSVKNPSSMNEDLCVYTIRPYSANVCQLLIEFQRFELQAPTLNSNTNSLQCQDHLAVGDFQLCGNNSGQHLYFPFHVANGVKEFSMTFHLAQHWTGNQWALTITQLECPTVKKHNQFHIPFLNANMRTFFSMDTSSHSNEDVEKLAPSGCNQYFTQSSGIIKSFNFNNHESASYYLPNMKYVICVRSAPEATMIEYHINSFSMSNEVATSMGFDADCRSAVQTSGRREDYLMIPQSNVADNLNIQPTYYCGTSLQTHPSLLASPPFIMYFSSDSTTDGSEKGFHINYLVRTLY